MGTRYCGSARGCDLMIRTRCIVRLHPHLSSLEGLGGLAEDSRDYAFFLMCIVRLQDRYEVGGLEQVCIYNDIGFKNGMHEDIVVLRINDGSR